MAEDLEKELLHALNINQDSVSTIDNLHTAKNLIKYKQSELDMVINKLNERGLQKVVSGKVHFEPIKFEAKFYEMLQFSFIYSIQNKMYEIMNKRCKN